MLNPEQIAKMIENGKKARQSTDIFNPKSSPFHMSDAALEAEISKSEILDIGDCDSLPDDQKEILDYVMSTSYDTVTKTFKFSYSYANSAHLQLARKTVEHIISYIYNNIPLAANMAPPEFIDCILKFYADRYEKAVEAEGEPILYDMNFQNTTFGTEPTTELVESLYSFISEPSDENVDALKEVCAKMHVVSVEYAKQRDQQLRDIIGIGKM